MHAYSWPYDWLISRATFLYSSPFSIPIKWAHYIHNPMQPYHHTLLLLLHQDPIFPKNPPPILTFLKKRMEGGDQNLGNGGSRWNPTKEQINMLESLYKNGLRTPTAEQIQQITARLRDYGHIEGKNVFYWFQNHKARQRQKQKQKQESFAFYNRFLHAAANSPVYPSYQNVICSPCYIPPPKNDAVFYQQHPKVQLPTAQGTFKRSRTLIPQSIDSIKQIPTNQRYNTKSMDWISSSSHQETLDLFPIHPTGILKSRTHDDEGDDDEEREIKNPSFSAADKERGDDDHDHPFFDFFCGN